jgi:two-component system nitrogen regulation sensor histidine kinase GlnL
MSKIATELMRRIAAPAPDPAAILNAVAEPIFVLDAENRFAYLNMATEQFFAGSAATLLGQPLAKFIPEDSPIFSLIEQVRASESSVSEYGVTLEAPRIGSHFVSIEVSTISESPDSLVVSIQRRSIARKIDHQLSHRNAARSLTAMAAILAHEVKNPLSGIRGAAQLLEHGANQDDQELTRLICEEADRIVGVVDRMEMFADERPIERGPVNIHEILEHVRKVSKTGFAQNIVLEESYDPSLPPVFGNRGLLIQALINLVKNAAEAVDIASGRIRIATRYMQGIRLAVRGSGSRVDLPLMVSVEDNGPGIPDDLRAHLFDPFVTTKAAGKGLGLALVAKIVDDHGGVIEVDSEAGRTVFRLFLPTAPGEAKRR